MTTLAAMRYKGETWIASDKQYTAGRAAQGTHKWSVGSKYAIAACGDARSLTLLSRMKQEGVLDDEKLPADLIAETLKQLVVKDGYTADKEEAGAPSYGQSFLLVSKGRIYEVCGGFSLTSYGPHWTLGSGASLALGAIEAQLLDGADDARGILSRSMKIAAKYDPGTSGLWVKRAF